MNPDLDKLRRFAMSIGLVLIVYSLAAVELDTGETIHPLGIPLKINRPEYLGIGLVIASLWGMFRFLYYGVWKTESPPRKRNPILKKYQRTKPTFSLPEQREKWLEGIRGEFPRLPGLQITAVWKSKYSEEEIEKDFYGDNQGQMPERIIIPWPFYVAARLEDIDYFAPIWLNCLALGSWTVGYFK